MASCVIRLGIFMLLGHVVRADPRDNKDVKTKEELVNDIGQHHAQLVGEAARTRVPPFFKLDVPELLPQLSDRTGPDGVAFAGFFLTKEDETGFTPFRSEQPGSEETAESPFFVAFRKLAGDQRWLRAIGMQRKVWRFGYAFSREVAEAAGCPPAGGDEHWLHACLVCWRSSADGSAVSTMHSGSFGLGHLAKPKEQWPVPETEDINGVTVVTRKIKYVVPTPDDFKRWLLKCANQTVENAAPQLDEL